MADAYGYGGRLARQRLKAAYKNIYDELRAIVSRHDPIGIDSGDNADEYDPEVDTILPRLKEAHSADDVRRITLEEFARWLGDSIAGSEQQYDAMAHEIWELWQNREMRHDR